MAMNNSLAEVHPELVSEWSKKNLPLTPDDITFGSNKKVWWKGTCGHEWQTSIVPRFRACADQGKDLIHENQEQRSHEDARTDTALHAERADLFCVVLSTFAQGAGDHRGAADAKHRSYGHEQQENRRGKGDCRHLQIVMGLPDEERIRQIVDQHHEHCRHCGQCVL